MRPPGSVASATGLDPRPTPDSALVDRVDVRFGGTRHAGPGHGGMRELAALPRAHAGAAARSGSSDHGHHDQRSSAKRSSVPDERVHGAMIRPGAFSTPVSVWHLLQSPCMTGSFIALVLPLATTFARSGISIGLVPWAKKKLPAALTVAE